jgi:3-isopropylmalate dehydratase small subunit
MVHAKSRKEVSLDAQTLSILKIQAEKEGRNLKNFMEHVLKLRANSFEITEEYKSMIDEILEKDEKGELNFISEEEFRNRCKKR